MCLLYGMIGILVLFVLCLLVKLWLLRKGMQEVSEGFAERLDTDTNTLISVSCRDRHVLSLAETLNRELRTLRQQRHRYQNGDRELKEAVTNISHDLRTPLTAISGYLELLRREEMSEDAQRYLTLIAGRTEAMGQLTEELFRYSVILATKEELRAEDVCLNDVLGECMADVYGPLTERGIVPDIRMTEERVIRSLDRGAVQRVYGNILANAIRYSDGDLTVELGEGGEAVFSNRAAALDEVQVGRLFDRFYTVEAARNSHGLGLSIAKTLTEQMGGTITAEYADGRFVVYVRWPSAI